MPSRGVAVSLFVLLVSHAAWAADSPSDSIAPATPLSIRILLMDGEVLQTQRVRLGGLGMVTATKLDGRDSVFTSNRVRTITDEQGRDRTKEVLVYEQVVRVGGPGPKKEEAPAKEKGPHLSAHAGAALPLGSFGDLAETGFGLDASLHWRTGRREITGARVEFTEFGGDPRVENVVSTNTAGAIQQLRFRLWGGSVISRLLILPEHQVDPFLHLSLGAQGFTTSLSGPGGSGSHTAFALSLELGIGLYARLSDRMSAEFAAAYIGTSTGKSTTTANGVSFETSGKLQYLQFKAGVVRHFGSGG